MGDAFKPKDFKTYDYGDLDGKVLIIKTIKNENILIVAGKDIETGVTYILKEKTI